ncbi:hypothetical protein [Chitinophaga sp. YIM B06452]|uniref:hypothetical protein n=1 Tax=Chitinophaga sp. YIM B06452 TaxID=3082158 RepID=UPI0031FF2961
MEEQHSPAPASLTKEEVQQLIAGQMASMEQAVADKTVQLLARRISGNGTGAGAPAAPEIPPKGIPLSGFLEFARFYSTQASSSNRSLALGGIAIIWIFKKPDQDGPLITGLLNLPLFFLALSLSLDLLQYVFGGIAWDRFYEHKYGQWKRAGYRADFAKDIEAPNGISWPITIMFYLKVACTAVAYFFIIRHLATII